MSNKFFDFSLNIYFFKKINIPSILKIEIFCFNNLKFLIIGNQNKNFYFLIPKNLKIFFFNNFLFFHLNTFKNTVNKLYKYNK